MNGGRAADGFHAGNAEAASGDNGACSAAHFVVESALEL